MSSSQLWAMLAARGIQPDSVSGGHPTITPAEIARCLHGLARGPFLMGMVKEVGDVRVLRELEEELDRELDRQEDDFFIEVIVAGCRRRLVGLAVFEAVMPNPRPCSQCHSRGYIYVDYQPRACTECGQTGGRALTSHSRSELACIPWSTWRDKWCERYEAVHTLAVGWHGDALRHLAETISGLLSNPLTPSRLDSAVNKA